MFRFIQIVKYNKNLIIMFKISVFSIKYFTMKINIQDKLNVNNVEYIPKQRLDLIGKQNN